jgi:DNA-binding PadR family transcriptional regulator
MRRPTGPRQPPALKDFQEAKEYHSGDKTVWALLGKWQREGLISMKPKGPQVVLVTLTEAGRAALSGPRAGAAGQ